MRKPELNITPLVDIMLVLLAILMVTMPMVSYEERINLPKGSKSKEAKGSSIDIYFFKNKRILFNGKEFSFNEFADNFVLLSNRFKKDEVVFLKADKDLSYGEVMKLLKVIKEAGFNKVSLITK